MYLRIYYRRYRSLHHDHFNKVRRYHRTLPHLVKTVALSCTQPKDNGVLYVTLVYISTHCNAIKYFLKNHVK